MGALTLKSFPFELRGWDIEKFESIDPTDSFGSNTRVYISKQEIIQIEPDYSTSTINAWISDKGRQFFDNIFSSPDSHLKNHEPTSWDSVLKSLFKTLYLFDHCNTKKRQKHFFTIIFENLSLELLSLLTIVAQSYSFIKIKRAERIGLNNDLESNFQYNNSAMQNKSLKNSTLCLLISNNPRYESYFLNLKLRQRFLKGNFKCFVIGSLIDLTFPTNFLGTKLKIAKSIVEGNNLICKDFKCAKNPILIFNNELLKRADGNRSFEMMKLTNYSKLFDHAWNYNTLNNSLYETGLQNIGKFTAIQLRDTLQFSSFYFLNLTVNNVSNFKKITDIKLLNFNQKKVLRINKLYIEQTNSSTDENINIYRKNFVENSAKFNKYLYLPIKMFYENSETFINTEGLVKRTSKIIETKKTKHSWKLLRNFLNRAKKRVVFLDLKNNYNITYNLKKEQSFKNYAHFHFSSTVSLDFNASESANSNKLLFLTNYKFKKKRLKLINTKLKFWLDDFYIGGKDGYSQNSLTLSHCSNLIRSQETNFF